MLFEIVVCIIFLVCTNYTDFVGYKIKNKIILPIIIIGLVWGMYQGEVSNCLFGMIIPLVLFPLYALKMLGAGDVKALCAIGAVVGFEKSIEILIFTFIGGGILALVIMIVNKNGKQRFKNLFNWFRNCFYTRKMESYNFGNNKKSYFRFSYAITIGFVFMVANDYFNIIVI